MIQQDSGKETTNSKKHFQDGVVSVIINKIATLIMRLVNRVESINGKKLELFVVILYCLGHILMYFVHEPWFDETLAWLIARDSSLYELLFVAPHFEGHPSLWHLVLAPFAKLGAPFELSLSLVSLVFSGLAIALFVYKAPLKRIIRLLMPFTYYLFFQYSVVSRPYCMLMLAFVLMAITFEKRNEKPGRFVLAMWFSCISSVYGIVISGGICIAWLIEMLISASKISKNNYSINGRSPKTIQIFFKNYLFTNGKIFWLAGLLAYVIFILVRVIPSESAYAVLRLTKIDADNGLIIRLLYTFFGMLSDLFFTNVLYTTNTLRAADIIFSELAAASLIGIGIIVCLFIYGKKKSKGDRRGKVKSFFNINHLYFTVPYVLLSIFTSIVYLYYHHVGILLLFIGYWMWTSTEGNANKSDKEVDKTQLTAEDVNVNIVNYNTEFGKKKIYSSFVVIAVTFMILIPLYWSVTSCIMDVKKNFGSGRMAYEFLKENGLDEGYTILTDFGKLFNDDVVPDDYTSLDIIFSQKGVSVDPYLKKDIILNTPGLVGKSYAYMHEIPNKEQTLEIIEKLKEAGLPDIMIGAPIFNDLFNFEYVNYVDYTLVYEDFFGNITKGVAQNVITYVFVKNELAEEKGLEQVDLTFVE